MQTKPTAIITAVVAVTALVYLFSVFEQQLLAQVPFPITVTAGVIIAGVIAGLIIRNPLFGGIAAAVGGAAGQFAAIAAGAKLASLIPQLTVIQSLAIVVVAMFFTGALLSLIFRTLTYIEEAEVLPEKEEEQKEITEEEKEEETFKICKFCNEKIPAEAIFCPFCGYKLVEESIKSE